MYSMATEKEQQKKETATKTVFLDKTTHLCKRSCPSVRLSNCPSVCPTIRLFIQPSVCPFVYPSIRPSRLQRQILLF